jgi:cell wall-associated NlpC family hydrolase
LIQVGALIVLFKRMLDEHWAYEWGAAREGCVDCSGAFVWAYKQLGASIEHGSNSIAHLRVGEYVPIAEAKPGYAVFKTRAWRESDNGNRWFGQQPGDVYHIGLMGDDGKVLNAQSAKTGFVASDAAGWAFAAPLKDVIYKEGDGKMYGNATVSVTSGYLNVREGASTRSKIIAKAENGARVNIIREAGGTGWVFGALASGEAGYMAGEYLVRDDALSAPSGQLSQGESQEEDEETTSLRRSDGVYITLAGKWEIAKD